MLVGVDICNTIANINYELLQMFDKLTLKQYPAPEVPKDFFTSSEGLKLFQRARPYFQANEVLYKMATNGYRIIYITSRPKLAEFVTRRWLEINQFPLGRVEIVSASEKATLAMDAGMVAFFDDDPLVVSELIKKKIPNIFVKLAPYNRHIDGSSVRKFTDWGNLRNQKPLVKVRI